VIAFVKLQARAVERDTNAVEPRFAKPCQPYWKTPIGIEVDGSPIRFFSKEENRIFQKPPLGQGFSLTTLAKTDNGILRFFQVRKGNAENFVYGWNKPNPLL
jgi:hypothetical protein